MPLRIPASASCLIPGCQDKPTHILSLRMRRKDTGASWAPNTTAYFCNAHANSGSEIFIEYRPTKTGKNEIVVQGLAPDKMTKRTTVIR